MKNQTLQNLLGKQMNRSEFLTHIGASILMLAGVSGIIKSLTGPEAKKTASGYGGSSYGGKASKF